MFNDEENAKNDNSNPSTPPTDQLHFVVEKLRNLKFHHKVAVSLGKPTVFSSEEQAAYQNAFNELKEQERERVIEEVEKLKQNFQKWLDRKTNQIYKERFKKFVDPQQSSTASIQTNSCPSTRYNSSTNILSATSPTTPLASSSKTELRTVQRLLEKEEDDIEKETISVHSDGGTIPFPSHPPSFPRIYRGKTIDMRPSINYGIATKRNSNNSSNPYNNNLTDSDYLQIEEQLMNIPLFPTSGLTSDPTRKK
jgi:hypothetical protein